MSFIQINFIKKIIPKTLVTRFILIIALPSILAQIIAIQIFYDIHWYKVSGYSSRLIAKEIEALIFDINSHKIIKEFREKIYYNVSYIYLENYNLPYMPNNSIEELGIFQNELKSILKKPFVVDLAKNEKQIELYVQMDQNNVLKVMIPSKILINPSAFIFILWFIVITILLLFISLIFAKNQIKSIVELTKAADLYGQGNNIRNFKPSGAAEIRQAGIAFLKMKDRIQKQATKRTQMLAMISHDLRTPLTRIKLQVELLPESEPKEEFQKDIISMEQMIGSYLDFVRGEGGEKFIQVDLTKWIRSYISNNYEEKVIFISGNNSIYANIKPNAFQRALANIIGNAISHSNKVQISISYGTNNDVIISIEDNGPGIKDSDKKLVFKPFFRGNIARSIGSSSSVGLGLAIVNELIKGHYGKISLHDSRKLGGLFVKITLPALDYPYNQGTNHE